jgi:beta-galactosidase
MKRNFIIGSLLVWGLGFTGILSARENTLLTDNWHFQTGEVANAQSPGFDDHDWQTVSVPHCWGWEQAQVTNAYYRGPGWYRRPLELQPQPGQRYFLRFEAASQVSEIYLNGKNLGEHRGAFGAFCYEITDALNPNGQNLIAARVDNSKQPDVAPLSGDFNIYGGLYRPVHLLTTDQVCFTPLDHGSPGVDWAQTHVSKDDALIDFTAEISNSGRKSAHRTLTAKLIDATGNVVATETQDLAITGRQTPAYHLQLKLANPHLWNGRLDPYLYKAVAELSQDGQVTDSVEQNVGLRFYSVDPDKGFFLNGQPYNLHGVNRHQDLWNKGWAINEADQDRDLQLILELGATVVRCCHYQHSDYFYSICDQAGLLVWAEIPQVDVISTTPQFEETSRNQLLDLIRQSENHSAIFVWSLFNEIRAGTPDPHRLLEDLKITANGEDPTRPTIAATCQRDYPEMNKIPDLLGWNKYPGWYEGKPEDWGKSLDLDRASSRHGGYCLSEYGAGANPYQHEDNPPHPKPGGQWHPEEWQNEVHEHAWAAVKERPWVWGSFIWNVFDFTVATRHEGGVPSRNDKGLITTDRQLKKDVFYFYQANWSDQPVLYITSRRFTERTNAVTTVKVYSNADQVELLINGKSIATTSNPTNCVFLWPDVTLTPGKNEIEVRASPKNTALTDHCVWTLASQ